MLSTLSNLSDRLYLCDLSDFSNLFDFLVVWLHALHPILLTIGSWFKSTELELWKLNALVTNLSWGVASSVVNLYLVTFNYRYIKKF